MRAIATVIVTAIASKAIATATAITTVTTDSDATALFMNLAKALKRFAQISNLIAREGAGSAIGGRIYRCRGSLSSIVVWFGNLGVDLK